VLITQPGSSAQSHLEFREEMRATSPMVIAAQERWARS
jgi:hypothetical protein